MDIDFLKFETNKTNDQFLPTQNSLMANYMLHKQPQEIFFFNFFLKNVTIRRKTRTFLKKNQQTTLLANSLDFTFISKHQYAVIDTTGSVNHAFKHMAGRTIPNDISIDLDYFIDDIEIVKKSQFTHLIGFVEQENYLHHRLTPLQLFNFYYSLKQVKDPLEETNKMISFIGLQGEANNRIRSRHNGINLFLEKKVNLGIELIKQPQLLFLENIYEGLALHEVLLFNKILNRV